VTLFGIAVGLVGAVVLSRVMADYVYGITSTDPLTFAGACLTLMIVALLASYIPAQRAARMNPMLALRNE
jgi:ABC-type antimicrobial peptide transport system permease subunit